MGTLTYLYLAYLIREFFYNHLCFFFSICIMVYKNSCFWTTSTFIIFLITRTESLTWRNPTYLYLHRLFQSRQPNGLETPRWVCRFDAFWSKPLTYLTHFSTTLVRNPRSMIEYPDWLWEMQERQPTYGTYSPACFAHLDSPPMRSPLVPTTHTQKMRGCAAAEFPTHKLARLGHEGRSRKTFFFPHQPTLLYRRGKAWWWGSLRRCVR